MSDQTPQLDQANSVGPLLRMIFEGLDAAGLCWAVLRNGEMMPDDTPNDVDLLIKPTDVPAARTLIEQACGKHGWRVISHVNKQHYFGSFILSPGDEPRCFPIDLFTGLSYRGNLFGDAQWALANRRRNDRGIWLVPPGFEMATGVVKELLHHLHLHEKKHDKAQRVAQAQRDDFVRSLTPWVEASLANQLCDACAAGDWAAVDALAPSLRQAVRRRSPAGLLRRLAFVTGQVFGRRFAGLSSFVVLAGPDGSGKTTLAEGLASRLHKRPCRGSVYLRANFGVLPELKQFKIWAGRLVGKSIKVNRPSEPGEFHSGMIDPLPAWRSMIYVPYYALDLCLGRLRLWHLRGQGMLIIFDRYYYDYYFQRGHRNMPRWWLALFGWLVPRPDLAVFVDRDAQEIHDRKPELSADEIRYQQDAIKQLLGGKPWFCHIDGRAGVQATLTVAANAVRKQMLDRK